MNKLFIIGNGFDLAHGYPTAYSDFVKWIWNNIHHDVSNAKFRTLVEINLPRRYFGVFSGTKIDCFNDFMEIVEFHTRGNPYTQIGGLNGVSNRNTIYSFKNKFFYTLCITYPDAKWSDIESLFYRTLIEVMEEKKPNGINIDSLNSDMEHIKELFSEYLNESIEYKKLNFEMSFTDLLRYKSKNLNKSTLSSLGVNYLNEFPSELKKSLLKFDSLIETAEAFNNWTLNGTVPQTLILDFNYTDTINQYINSAINRDSYEFGIITHIKIHGDLNDKNNPINLGFGDEMDDHYKTLEKKNDNRFLSYIKSFMYSNNTNYRNLLNWIDTNDFQVYILGHSCGLSDRIMLNTIFEHERCKSIKVFYYQWKDLDIVKDDFTDKIQNISRHFNKKKQMRDKIVDKSLCQPLKV